MSKVFHLGIVAAIAFAATPVAHAQLVRSGAAANAAGILSTVNQFRLDLGHPNNGNAVGEQPTGRREINWVGGGAAAPATLFPNPMTTFNSPPTTR